MSVLLRQAPPSAILSHSLELTTNNQPVYSYKVKIINPMKKSEVRIVRHGRCLPDQFDSACHGVKSLDFAHHVMVYELFPLM